MPISPDMQRIVDHRQTQPPPRKPAPTRNADPILGGPKAPLGESRKGDPNPAANPPAWGRKSASHHASNPKRANERRGIGHNVGTKPNLAEAPVARPMPKRYRRSLWYNYAMHRQIEASMANAMPRQSSAAARNPRRSKRS